jgi:hypothetical protein
VYVLICRRLRSCLSAPVLQRSVVEGRRGGLGDEQGQAVAAQHNNAVCVTLDY